MIGVFLNILLFIGKFFAGKISGSVSIMADAFNNLTDAGTFLLSSFGIKIAAVGPGKNHPKGHGKFEWIIALITSLSVFLVGWELFKSSIQSIKNPEDTVFSWITLVILLVSIFVKLFLYFYNIKKSKLQDLLSLKAVAIDSISDAFSTTAVLISLLLNHWFGWQLDGWFGLAVSLLIIYNSITASFDSISRLADKAAPKEKLDELANTVNSFFTDEVPIYELELVDYGFGRYCATFHLASTESTPVSELIQKIPLIEEKLKKDFEYTSIIQVEESAEKQTQTNLLNKVQSNMNAAGYTFKLSEARVIKSTNQHLQLVMTVLVPFLDKQQKEKFNKFLSSKAALGIDEHDSSLITIRLGGYHARERGYSNRHYSRCKRSISQEQQG